MVVLGTANRVVLHHALRYDPIRDQLFLDRPDLDKTPKRGDRQPIAFSDKEASWLNGEATRLLRTNERTARLLIRIGIEALFANGYGLMSLDPRKGDTCAEAIQHMEITRCKILNAGAGEVAHENVQSALQAILQNPQGADV